MRLLEAGIYTNEKDLDTLVLNQRKLIADLLLENEIMDDGSTLKFIGQRFFNVDLLFAEVDDEEACTRLVPFEDKLLKNPESKRQVIGQIVDYAARFANLVRSDALLERYPEHAKWIHDNAELLDRQLERGDFLLVVCGDEIHPNVADIVGRLARRADHYPTVGMEMCLIAIDLYGDATQRYLIPHLMGRIARAERRLQITVQVKDGKGELLQSSVATQETKEAEPELTAPALSPDKFFKKNWLKFGRESVHAWNQFVNKLIDAAIPVSRSLLRRRENKECSFAVLYSIACWASCVFGIPNRRCETR